MEAFFEACPVGALASPEAVDPSASRRHLDFASMSSPTSKMSNARQGAFARSLVILSYCVHMLTNTTNVAGSLRPRADGWMIFRVCKAGSMQRVSAARSKTQPFEPIGHANTGEWICSTIHLSMVAGRQCAQDGKADVHPTSQQRPQRAGSGYAVRSAKCEVSPPLQPLRTAYIRFLPKTGGRVP